MVYSHHLGGDDVVGDLLRCCRYTRLTHQNSARHLSTRHLANLLCQPTPSLRRGCGLCGPRASWPGSLTRLVGQAPCCRLARCRGRCARPAWLAGTRQPLYVRTTVHTHSGAVHVVLRRFPVQVVMHRQYMYVRTVLTSSTCMYLCSFGSGAGTTRESYLYVCTAPTTSTCVCPYGRTGTALFVECRVGSVYDPG